MKLRMIFKNNVKFYRKKLKLSQEKLAELSDLKLKIEDYSKEDDLRALIRDYYNTMDEYVRMKSISLFIQNRVFL